MALVKRKLKSCLEPNCNVEATFNFDGLNIYSMMMKTVYLERNELYYDYIYYVNSNFKTNNTSKI